MNSSCMCHFALDPLGSFFYGFDYYYESYYMTPEYNASAERNWETGTGAPPGFFGSPAAGLADLGVLVGSDPRFLSCAVDEVFTGLLHRKPTVDEFPRQVAHREDFLRKLKVAH